MVGVFLGRLHKNHRVQPQKCTQKAKDFASVYLGELFLSVLCVLSVESLTQPYMTGPDYTCLPSCVVTASSAASSTRCRFNARLFNSLEEKTTRISIAGGVKSIH